PAQLGVTEKPDRKVPWRGKARGPQTAWRPTRPEHPYIEAVLHVQAVGKPKPRGETDELSAAAEEDVLTVVDLLAAHREGRGASAQQAPTLEELHRQARLFELDGSGPTGQPTPHPRYPPP